MRIELSQHLRQEMQMRLSPQMIQTLQLLQVPTLQLIEKINQELLENPILEEVAPAEIQKSVEENQEKYEQIDKEFEKLNKMDQEWKDYFASSSISQARGEEKDKKMEAMLNTASRPASLQDYLVNQLGFLGTRPDLRKITEYIIYNIDANGYLLYPLETLIDSMDEKPGLDDAKEALRLVQSLDPPGIGAIDIKECLLLQLSCDPQERFLERKLIINHLEDIQKNRLPKIQKELGEPFDKIKKAIDYISQLNPKPGALFGGDRPQYVLPDVVVEMIDGRYEVRLENSYIPHIRISPHYQKLFREKGDDPQTLEYIKKKLDSARWLIDSIQQRQNTLYKIAREIVTIQGEFFEKGIHALHPLKMQEVADAVGVHVSTVSRAIANKYLQAPNGIYEMKFFFTGAAKRTDGEEAESRTSVLQRIRRVVNEEDKGHPMSDEEVVDKLKAQGLNIARRTVTKYRKAMKIPSSRQRKIY